MLFKSRYKESFTNKINKYLWPKKGWKRSGKYLSLRIRRLPGTPHGIALGFAFGVAMSMTPVVGAHLVFALLLSWIFGGSLTSTLIGTFIGNPWTFPVIWAVTYKIGYFIVPSDTLESVNLVTISNELSLLGQTITSIVIHGNFYKAWDALNNLDLIPPMLIGSIPVLIIVGILSYFLSRKLVNDYQNRRKLKIEKKIKNKNK